jgi:hypothetical protein
LDTTNVKKIENRNNNKIIRKYFFSYNLKDKKIKKGISKRPFEPIKYISINDIIKENKFVANSEIKIAKNLRTVI